MTNSSLRINDFSLPFFHLRRESEFSWLSEDCIWKPVIGPSLVDDNDIHQLKEMRWMMRLLSILERLTEYINEWSLMRNVTGLDSYIKEANEIPNSWQTIILFLISNDNYANPKMEVTCEHSTAEELKPWNGYFLKAWNPFLWKIHET